MTPGIFLSFSTYTITTECKWLYKHLCSTAVLTSHLDESRDIDTNTLERRTDIQVDLDDIMLNRLLVVGKMLSINNRRVSGNLKGNDTLVVLGLDETDDSELIDVGLHGHGVVSRLESEIREDGCADGLSVDGEVHGQVTEFESHDGGVGNVDCADHVGAVFEDLVFSGEDLDVVDVEALEAVETWGSVRFV